MSTSTTYISFISRAVCYTASIEESTEHVVGPPRRVFITGCRTAINRLCGARQYHPPRCMAPESSPRARPVGSADRQSRQSVESLQAMRDTTCGDCEYRRRSGKRQAGRHANSTTKHYARTCLCDLRLVFTRKNDPCQRDNIGLARKIARELHPNFPPERSVRGIVVFRLRG